MIDEIYEYTQISLSFCYEAFFNRVIFRLNLYKASVTVLTHIFRVVILQSLKL